MEPSAGYVPDALQIRELQRQNPYFGARPYPVLRTEILSTKSEIRNKHEIQNQKSETVSDDLNFRFRICFEFRYSNFEFPRGAREESLEARSDARRR